MKGKNIVCIFAHPDDEAFGPSGTIANWSQQNKVFLICVTDGQNSKADTHAPGTVRKKELLESSKILGVKKTFFLNYKDGELKNNIYNKVSHDLEKILEKIKPEILMTFELRGVTGHLDHVFVSMVTSFLFENLSFVKKIYYFALPKTVSLEMKDYFIFFPEGFDRGEADHIEPVSNVQERKVEAIIAHKSQSKDVKTFLKLIKKNPKEELFFVSEKKVKRLASRSENR